LILEKSNVPHREEIFPVIIITVVMSVLAHGVTAVPGAKMYARALEKFRDDDLHEHGEVTEHRVKIRHSK
jgi:NhaP-type Na+/H+ or K+/H+ antiporter